MPFGLRIVLGFMLAFTGQSAVINTMLLAGVDWMVVFVVGIAVFVVIVNLTVWRKP